MANSRKSGASHCAVFSCYFLSDPDILLTFCSRTPLFASLKFRMTPIVKPTAGSKITQAVANIFILHVNIRLEDGIIQAF